MPVASAYLHDIGMSYAACGELEDPDHPDYENRRRNHAENGSHFILENKDIKKIIPDDNARQDLARITNAHSGDPGLICN